MRPRLVFLLIVFFVGLVYFFYHRNPEGWAKVADDASAAVHFAKGASWGQVVTDAKAAAKPPPPAPDDDSDSAASASAAAEPGPATSPATASAPAATAPAPAVTAPSSVAATKAPVPDTPRFPVPVPSPPPTNWATFATTGISGGATNATAAAAPSPGTSATSSAAPASAPFVAAKPWSPPDVMPSQPHWVWTTSDGHEYDDVVVTQIAPDSVSITHSRGAAHVAIDTLPPEIQKQLGYDPAAAAAAKKEARREADHPFYRLTELEDAKAAARELHWPLAWMCGDASALSQSDPVMNSETEVQQMALNALKTQAVVVFLDGDGDLSHVAPSVLQQFFQLDDGPLPGGHHFYWPKIVFSDSEGRRALGRAAYTQMKESREAALAAALVSIEYPTTNAPAGVPTAPTAKP